MRMGIFQKIKDFFKPLPDVYYVHETRGLTEAEKREVAELKDANEKLSMTLELMKQKERAARRKQEAARSIRGQNENNNPNRSNIAEC